MTSQMLLWPTYWGPQGHLGCLLSIQSILLICWDFFIWLLWSTDIFDTVNLSFWGWSIGSASRSCARYGTLYCRQDPHRRSEIKGKPGKLDLNPRVKGAVAEVSRSCNTSKKSGLSRSNRSVVLLQSNFKSLKIASAVAPCLCGTSCALSCGDSRHSCSSSSSQQPDLILNYRLEIKIGNVKFNAVKLLEISNSMLISGCQ